jgi:uridine kinase
LPVKRGILRRDVSPRHRPASLPAPFFNEAPVSMNRAQVVAELADRIQRKPSKRPLRVGIDGRTGAGKTTFADQLADRLEDNGRTCLRAGLADFHFPGHEERRMSGAFTPEAYVREPYDSASIRRLLLDPLGPGGDGRCRLDLWNAYADEPFPEDWIVAEPDTILLADGVFLLTPALRAHWDFTIWLDVDWETLLRRAAHRADNRSRSSVRVREEFKTGWMPRHLLYEQGTRPHELVDVVIDNGDIEHPYFVRLRPSSHATTASR